MEQTTEIQRLRQRIETSVGYSLHSPKDFDTLAEQIFAKLGVMMSPTTLKRIWGYLDNPGEPRHSTLEILARFVGYSSWEAFADSTEEASLAEASNLILKRHLNASEIAVGERIALSWLPDHGCTIKCLNEGGFEVLESCRSTLSAGDTFRCNVFIEGEPLYVDHLCHDRYEGVSYVAGKQGGIRFQLLDRKPDSDSE